MLPIASMPRLSAYMELIIGRPGIVSPAPLGNGISALLIPLPVILGYELPFSSSTLSVARENPYITAAIPKNCLPNTSALALLSPLFHKSLFCFVNIPRPGILFPKCRQRLVGVLIKGAKNLNSGAVFKNVCILEPRSRYVPPFKVFV